MWHLDTDDDAHFLQRVLASVAAARLHLLHPRRLLPAILHHPHGARVHVHVTALAHGRFSKSVTSADDLRRNVASSQLNLLITSAQVQTCRRAFPPRCRSRRTAGRRHRCAPFWDCPSLLELKAERLCSLRAKRAIHSDKAQRRKQESTQQGESCCSTLTFGKYEHALLSSPSHFLVISQVDKLQENRNVVVA